MQPFANWRFKHGWCVFSLQTMWYSLDNYSFILWKFVFRSYLKSWNQKFSSVSSRYLKWNNKLHCCETLFLPKDCYAIWLHMCCQQFPSCSKVSKFSLYLLLGCICQSPITTFDWNLGFLQRWTRGTGRIIWWRYWELSLKYML